MKRPPGLWILLSLGVLWITVQDVYAVRATALIFGRSTTTTTSTETPESSSAESADEEEAIAVTEPTNATADGNTTKPTLTGNPQIDYKWDPNLPSELKGYDLSDYPFYERVPNLEGLEFKCDGLHDGFYASIPHKCQVYHHCLFGTRYDFLCANYTAFDQKTFICQFVSIVDCENSKKYWHRNDDLYQVASTTTQKPLRSIYTPPPEVDGGSLTLPATAPGGGGLAGRPAAGRRPYRPQRPRRPQFDYYDEEYYDDYYDERPRGRRKRPRPRPRPLYDDEYEEYDEERYESRRSQGRRRPNRGDRDRRKNKGRRKPEKADYDDEDEEVDERFEDDDFVESAKKQNPTEDRRKLKDEEDEPPRGRKRSKDKRRRPDDDLESETPRKPARKGSRRPSEDVYDDEVSQSDESRSYEDNSRPNKKKKPQPEEQDKDGRPIIKPVSGSIYDRPRLAPRINLPVPKNAADKFSYKKVGQTTKKPANVESKEAEDEYYDEYEDLPPKRKNNQRNRPEEPKKDKPRNEDSKNQSTTNSKRTRKPESQESSEEKQERTTPKPKYGSGRKFSTTVRTTTTTTQSSKRKPSVEEYDDEDYEIEEKEVPKPQSPFKVRNRQREKPSTTSTTSTTTAATTTTTTTPTTTTTTTEAPQKEVMVRIVKRPFLPSRGGNPYSARGLQPIGTKAVERPASFEEDEPSAEDTRALQEVPIQKEQKQVFKPSPILIKIPVRTKYTAPSADAQEDFDSESSRQQNYKTKDYLAPRPTQKPQRVPERNPLDLNEYDVTLNDALNPTLPNLPIRNFPTGFSNAANDYTYSTYQRPRYVQVEPVISQSNPEITYQPQVVRQQPQRYEQFPPNNQYSTINGGYRRKEAPSAQTQALYSSY